MLTSNSNSNRSNSSFSSLLNTVSSMTSFITKTLVPSTHAITQSEYRATDQPMLEACDLDSTRRIEATGKGFALETDAIGGRNRTQKHMEDGSELEEGSNRHTFYIDYHREQEKTREMNGEEKLDEDRRKGNENLSAAFSYSEDTCCDTSDPVCSVAPYDQMVLMPDDPAVTLAEFLLILVNRYAELTLASVKLADFASSTSMMKEVVRTGGNADTVVTGGVDSTYHSRLFDLNAIITAAWDFFQPCPIVPQFFLECKLTISKHTWRYCLKPIPLFVMQQLVLVSSKYTSKQLVFGGALD
ncbi:unnamed protein product [Protopolystoma xenopodis]|uniref:Uncharacterized protein n=1 Tax=Protopolystoma xenopodis TaxID=117903 RepID=A0A448XED8_9PLAT|nr:unnamed protein product [Protopolystoma xenopodis]